MPASQCPYSIMMAKKKKLFQGQMCWVLAAECGCYYQGPSISSQDLDFFLNTVLILVVLFPSLFFLNYSLSLTSFPGKSMPLNPGTKSRGRLAALTFWAGS